LPPKTPSGDPDLDALVNVWPNLPAAIRAGILAMIGSFVTQPPGPFLWRRKSHLAMIDSSATQPHQHAPESTAARLPDLPLSSPDPTQPALPFFKGCDNPRPGGVYTYGYDGKNRAALIAFLGEREGVLVDIRMTPFGSAPDWNKPELIAALGDRYVHVQALGNVNYRTGGPIQLSDKALGVQTVEQLAAKHGAVVLMCACASYESCHRRIVAELLRGRSMAVKGELAL
jgi:hypothetical protein